MRTETREVFISFDGKTFTDANECHAYEKENGDALLIGLSHRDLEMVLAGENAARADAIERFARKCTAARMQRGERKRKPKVSKEAIQRIAEGHAP